MTTLLTATIDWGFIWMVTITGFLTVFVMLILLVFVMKLFGVIFTHKPKNSKTEVAQPKNAKESIAIISDEEVAAITTALKLYNTAMHDREMEVITIHRVKSAYSPWNSKIHGLTQMPDYKGKN